MELAYSADDPSIGPARIASMLPRFSLFAALVVSFSEHKAALLCLLSPCLSPAEIKMGDQRQAAASSIGSHLAN